MATVSIIEAQAKLLELIHQLNPGEELVITENDQPVARLVSTVPAINGDEGLKRSFGGWADEADDLDEYLQWSRQQRKQSRPGGNL